MRFWIMHRTDATWEAGAKPSPELIARVGGFVGELVQKGLLRAGEGLGPSSQGARLRVAGGKAESTPGPFASARDVPAGFVIVKVADLDEAVGWARKVGAALGDAEIDVRPVNEPWDIGVAAKPPGAKRRFMAVQAGDGPPSPAQEAALAPVIAEMKAAGVLLTREALQPTAKGARIVRHHARVSVLDGPFAEAKELVGGYVIVDVPDLASAVEWGRRYFEVVETPAVDVREVVELA